MCPRYPRAMASFVPSSIRCSLFSPGGEGGKGTVSQAWTASINPARSNFLNDVYFSLMSLDLSISLPGARRQPCFGFAAIALELYTLLASALLSPTFFFN